MKKFRVVLQFSKSDQEKLGYQNPNFTFDYPVLMGRDFINIGDVDKQEILDALRGKLHLSGNYLNDYSVIARSDNILVIKE